MLLWNFDTLSDLNTCPPPLRVVLPVGGKRKESWSGPVACASHKGAAAPVHNGSGVPYAVGLALGNAEAERARVQVVEVSARLAA